MNDTGIPAYTDHDLSVQVLRRKDVINEILGDSHPILEQFFNKHKAWLNKILLQLPEAWTEADILPYLEDKLRDLETEREENYKMQKMNAEAINSKAQKLAFHLWRSAIDARHKSDELDAWSHIVKDTLLSSKWIGNAYCDPEAVCRASSTENVLADSGRAQTTELEENECR